MKQIAQYQDGRLEFQDVPVPKAPPGGVLVRTLHSVISVGTEKMKVEQARMNLLQKAKARPDQVRKVLDTARNLGWKSALDKVRNRLESPTPLGYSAAGIIEEVDAANSRYRVGDIVACGGAECAFHAEYIALPEMLVARVPDGVSTTCAAYTTICSIALQAVRQTDIGIGDRVLVMGQGLVGLLVTNLLKIAGAQVAAVDIVDDREDLCRTMGADRFINPLHGNFHDVVREWTDGFGADAAVICTASKSNTPIEQSAEALRDRGRLVDVGITRIELPWKLFYEKELEVRFSRSYGPGRYDPSYEWGGVDYPIGYVRWTEHRNFQACLQLMQERKLALEAITTSVIPFEKALEKYDSMSSGESQDIGVVLSYPSPDGESSGVGAASTASGSASVTGGASGAAAAAAAGGVTLQEPATGLHVIGAGNFARTMLLPHLRDRIPFRTITNHTSLSARHVKEKFGFESAFTHYEEALNGAGASDAVLIATRHHLHAPMVLDSLNAGAHVFVEKPLCLTLDELVRIDKAVEASARTVQVGFNRRFAPVSTALKQLVERTPGPKTATIRVMAGRLAPDHWYANFQESGGRILGEACHFFDFFCFLFGSRPVRVYCHNAWPVEGRLPFPDSISALVEFADGSSGQLIYTAEGDTGYPKETMSVYGAGFVSELTNFQTMDIYKGRRRLTRKSTSKGHAEQMQAWASFLQGREAQPLPYSQARTSMLVTFAALASIRRGAAVSIDLDDPMSLI